jgi:hypothetical protein
MDLIDLPTAVGPEDQRRHVLLATPAGIGQGTHTRGWLEITIAPGTQSVTSINGLVFDLVVFLFDFY